MFDLEFFKSVANVMEWTENAPSSKFLTVHQSVMEARNYPAGNVDHETMELRMYISEHYPRYFEKKISVGEKTTKNINKIMQALCF
jgi:GTP-dependent phosphoenolpyruvate carboxykinase